MTEFCNNIRSLEMKIVSSQEIIEVNDKRGVRKGKYKRTEGI